MPALLLSFLNKGTLKMALAFLLCSVIGLMVWRINYLGHARSAAELRAETAEADSLRIADQHRKILGELVRVTNESKKRTKTQEKTRTEIANAPPSNACANSPAIRAVTDSLRKSHGDGKPANPG